MESVGVFLRKQRQLRQLSLEELSQTTRIPLRMLRCIERDRFEELPGTVFARGYLRSYARALGVEAEPVVARFARNRPETKIHAPMTAITPPERGRRVGIAIALVILLMMFTLALSIVLRPRKRDVPVELSWLEHQHNVTHAAREPRPCCSARSTTVTPIKSSPC